MYHIIYRMKNHSTCFRSFPLFVSVVFTLTMSISRDYHRDCISHDTHSSHSSSLSGTLGTKKKSLLENNIEWNGFIFVLRSNVCAYLHCVVIIVLFSLFFYNDVLSCLSYNIDTGERMISPSLLCVDGRRREWADVMTSEPTVSFTKYKKNKKRRFKNNNKKNSFPLSWSFCVGGRFAFARLIAGFSVTIGVSCHLGSSVGRH